MAKSALGDGQSSEWKRSVERNLHNRYKNCLYHMQLRKSLCSRSSLRSFLPPIRRPRLSRGSSNRTRHQPLNSVKTEKTNIGYRYSKISSWNENICIYVYKYWISNFCNSNIFIHRLWRGCDTHDDIYTRFNSFLFTENLFREGKE